MILSSFILTQSGFCTWKIIQVIKIIYMNKDDEGCGGGTGAGKVFGRHYCLFQIFLFEWIVVLDVALTARASWRLPDVTCSYVCLAWDVVPFGVSRFMPSIVPSQCCCSVLQFIQVGRPPYYHLLFRIVWCGSFCDLLHQVFCDIWFCIIFYSCTWFHAILKQGFWCFWEGIESGCFHSLESSQYDFKLWVSPY